MKGTSHPVISSVGHLSVSVGGIVKRSSRSVSLVQLSSCPGQFCLDGFIFENEIDMLFRNLCTGVLISP